MHYFNAERMNPHIPEEPAGNMRNMILRIRGGFSSHGEIMKDAMTSIPLQRGETLLIDEPEAAQDMESVQRILLGFDEICRQGGQVIAATHHPLLMKRGRIVELLPGYVQTLRSVYCRSICGD